MGKIYLNRSTSLESVGKEAWESDFNLPVHLNYNTLMVLEKSKINSISSMYLRYFSDREAGRSNFVSCGN